MLVFVVGFIDAEGDLLGGPGCRVTSVDTGRSVIAPFAIPAGADLNARAGRVACPGYTSHFEGLSVPVTVEIGDRAGNVSAPVRTTLVLEEPAE